MNSRYIKSHLNSVALTDHNKLCPVAEFVIYGDYSPVAEYILIAALLI
jgi:hypothetical protein